MQPKYDPVLGALVDPSVNGIGFDAMLGRMTGGNGTGTIFDPFGGKIKTPYGGGTSAPRTGRLFDAGLVDDANLLAYFPLHDGNLVDVVSERKRLMNPEIPLNTLTNYGCTYVPGVGFSSGSGNSSNFMHSPVELGINGGDCIVSLVAKILPNQAGSSPFPILAMERSSSAGVVNGVCSNTDNGTVFAFRLQDKIQWNVGGTVSPADRMTKFYQYFQRVVFNNYIETGVNGGMGPGSYCGGATGNPSDPTLPGVTLFSRHIGAIGAGGSYLSEAGSAIISEVSFWKTYQPAAGWIQPWYEAYTVPPLNP